MTASLTQPQPTSRVTSAGVHASLLVVGDDAHAGDSLRGLLADHVGPIVRAAAPEDCAAEALSSFDAAVVIFPGAQELDSQTYERWGALVGRLEEVQVGTLVLEGGRSRRGLSRGDGRFVCRVGDQASEDELFGRLEMMIRYRLILRGTESELDRMEQLGDRLQEHFAEVDQELRLASRLQRDFLPRDLPQVGPVRFSALYQPARWVSGDIYDVVRLDEANIGFYVADAVGHGIAAGLLTMFIKRALPMKRIEGESYHIFAPDQSLACLNDSLAEQHLPNCQFATACYCILNCETLEMTFARGGHPYPVLIQRDGTVRELEWAGPLLGVFPGMSFPCRHVRLARGDKVLLYTDGIEDCIVPQRHWGTRQAVFGREFLNIAHLPAAELTRELGEILQTEEGSISPADDTTVVVMEVLEDGRPA